MTCPACSTPHPAAVLAQQDVPVNSCVLLDTRDEAGAYPTGDIDLRHCPGCGFVFNAAFDPGLIEYSARYEESQAFSPRFRTFQQDLAKHWIDRYELAGRRVLEIGCGKGDFLVELCEQGAGPSIGIDPSVAPHRVDSPAADRITWIAEFYSQQRHGDLDADAVLCRHTLEHIPDVAAFLRAVRAGVGDRTATPVLFEVPDTLRVLHEGAFWDVYYEHCSYFTPGSLARLFRTVGFAVADLWRAYDDQYLIIEASPGAVPVHADPHPLEEDTAVLDGAVHTFRDTYRRSVDAWRQRLRELADAGGTAAIWGAGSKAVAFLTALGTGAAIAAAVDINPYKHGMFLAGSGQQIVAPADLPTYDPDLVVAMNPVYLAEIRQELQRLGIDADLVGV